MKTISESGSGKGSQWAGRILTGIVTVLLTATGGAKLAGAPRMVDGLTHAGIPESAIVPIAVLELVCVLLYVLPRTTVLGTFLLTGYFGGATVTHLIGGESVVPPLMIGLVIWAGAWLRTAELRALLPVRQGQQGVEAYAGARDRQQLAARG